MVSLVIETRHPFFFNESRVPLRGVYLSFYPALNIRPFFFHYLQISFKSLLVVHLLTRSDAGNDVLSYCASQRGILSAAYKGGANSKFFGNHREKEKRGDTDHAVSSMAFFLMTPLRYPYPLLLHSRWSLGYDSQLRRIPH